MSIVNNYVMTSAGVWVPMMGSAGGALTVEGSSTGAMLPSNGIQASGSFTNANAAYAAGDTISVAQEFAFTDRNGVAIPSGALVRILSTAMKIDEAAVTAGQTSYTAQAYVSTPPSALADNAAWTLSSADLAPYRGSVTLGTPADLGNAQYIRTPAIDTDIKLTGTSLWLYLVTTTALTGPPAAVARQVFLYGIVL